MTTPDYTDWTTPTASADHIVQVIPANTECRGAYTATVDGSQFQSLVITIKVAAIAPLQRMALAVEFFQSGLFMGQRSVTFHGQGAYPENNSDMTWRIPLLGNQFRLLGVGAAGDSIKVGVVGSSRPITTDILIPDLVGVGRELLDTGNQVVAAAAQSAIAYVRPCAVGVALSVTAGIANLRWVISGISYASPAVNAGRIYNHQGLDASGIDFTLYAPDTGLEVIVQNKGAASATFAITAWDIS